MLLLRLELLCALINVLEVSINIQRRQIGADELHLVRVNSQIKETHRQRGHGAKNGGTAEL